RIHVLPKILEAGAFDFFEKRFFRSGEAIFDGIVAEKLVQPWIQVGCRVCRCGFAAAIAVLSPGRAQPLRPQTGTCRRQRSLFQPHSPREPWIQRESSGAPSAGDPTFADNRMFTVCNSSTAKRSHFLAATGSLPNPLINRFCYRPLRRGKPSNSLFCAIAKPQRKSSLVYFAMPLAMAK